MDGETEPNARPLTPDEIMERVDFYQDRPGSLDDLWPESDGDESHPA